MRPKTQDSVGDRNVDALIDSFSDCTLYPQLWEAALTSLTELLGANTVILWIYNEPLEVVDAVPVRADPVSHNWEN